MGLLKEMNVPIREVPVAKEVPAPVAVAAPVPEPIHIATVGTTADQIRKRTELIPKRNKHGLIESVTGYDAAGNKVTFEFDRDGKRSLTSIKVR